MARNRIPLTFALAAVMAQTAVLSNAQDDPEPAVIRGTAKDDTGAPFEGASIYATSGIRRFTTKADAQGRYELRNVFPDTYRIRASGRFGDSQRRTVTVSPGQEVSAIDFRLRRAGEIIGRVIDENNEPVPNVNVYLIGEAYEYGEVRFPFRSFGKTDDRGAYRIHIGVKPGLRYRVLAKPRDRLLPAITDIPADPKMRRKALRPTYFHSATSIDGAEVITLRSGEVREGVDIRTRRGQSYCIEGVVQAGGRSGALKFGIEEPDPAQGHFREGGLVGSPPGGMTGPDGRLRICDLQPGEYRLTGHSPGLPNAQFFYGAVMVAITDEDVRNVTVPAHPLLPLAGEVVWHGAPPSEPPEALINIGLIPLRRARFMGEATDTTSSIPGEFSFPGLLMDEYGVRITNLPRDLYLKDITYAGQSILHRKLRLGSAVGDARLRIIVGHDSAFLKAKITDEEGELAPAMHVFLLPANAVSEPDLADKVIRGQSDQYGVYSSRALAPGTYYVVPSDLRFNYSPGTIGKLWRARFKAPKVELAPDATKEVTFRPMAME